MSIAAGTSNKITKEAKEPNNKAVMSNIPHFNILPINKNYLFFQNKAYTDIPESGPGSLPTQVLSTETKNIFKKYLRENPNRRMDYGPGTYRPISFQESEMESIYYNTSFLNGGFASNSLLGNIVLIIIILLGPTMISVATAISIAALITSAVEELYTGSSIYNLPKNHLTDLYYYKKSTSGVKSNQMLCGLKNSIHPSIISKGSDAKVGTDFCLNMSRPADEFYRSIGSASDSGISLSEGYGGYGFTTKISKNTNQSKFSAYLNNIKTYSKDKYKSIDKFVETIDSTYKDSEENMVQELIDLLSLFFGNKGIINIDFSDYVTTKNRYTTNNKGYYNSLKHKSIFGPYICRSTYSWELWPSIFIALKSLSTLKTDNSSDTNVIGDVGLFGKSLPLFGVRVDDPFWITVFYAATGLVIPVIAIGSIGSKYSQQKVLMSPPLSFPGEKSFKDGS